MEELQDFIDNYLRVSDFRNISYENPVRFNLEPDSRTFILVSAYTEPSFSQTPFNVLWLCYDQADTDFYGKVWRRVSADKNPLTPTKRYTWEQITDMADLYSQDQYYQTIDETPSWEMGTSWAEVDAATTESLGLVMISEETDGTGITAVSGNDSRLSDARVPNEHDHPDFPRTMVHIGGVYQEDPQYADRVNDAEVFVRFSFAKLPTAAGQTFRLTHNNPSRPNEWFGVWSDLTREDFQDEPAILVTANPYTVSGLTTLEDNKDHQLVVDSLYSDNSAIVGDTGTWSVSNNSEGITINAQTGLLTVPDISEDVVVTVSVTTVDVNDPAITATGNISLNVRNSYVAKTPVSMVILGADSINEKNGTTYELEVLYSDGSKDIRPATTFMTSDSAVATITVAGEFDAKDIDSDMYVTLTATYVEEGVTVSATKDVLVIAEVTPIDITILGPTVMNELTSIQLQAEVSLSNNTSYIVNVSDATWTFVQTVPGVSASASLDAVTYQSTEELDSDQTFTVKVAGTFDGVYLEDVHDVSVKDVTIPPTPTLFEIIGADSIAEGDLDEPYSFQVSYDNGASSIVNADPGTFGVDNTTDASVRDDQTAPNGAVIVGVLSSITDITSNETVQLTAQYTENGTTLTAAKDVIIVAEPAKPVSMTISGPTEMNELETINLTATVLMDDNTTRVVSGSSTMHPTTWAFVQSATGISQSQGTTTQDYESSVDINADETFVVSATTTIEGIQVSATHTVQLKDVPLLPASLVIVGPTAVDENTVENYTFEVTWSDSSKTNVTATTASSNNAQFQFGTDGVGTIGEFATDATVTLTATYVANGQTVNATLNVSVDDIPVPETLTISGADTVEEGGTYDYVFTVGWSDGSTTTETLVDSTNVGHAGSTFNTSGELVVGSMESDDNYTLWARFSQHGVTVEGTKEVSFVANPVPVTLTIEGPTTISSDDTGTYNFKVEMSNGDTKTVTVDSFTSDNANATVNSNDVTVSTIASDENAQLSASYTEEGVTVTDTHDITLLAPAVPESIEIVGSSNVFEDSTTNYTFRVTYTDQSTRDVTPNNADTTLYDFGTDGVLNVPSVTEQKRLTLSCSYTEAGVTVNGSRDVNVLNNIDDVSNITITGNVPNPYYAGDPGIQLTATLTRDSGTTEDITNVGTWAFTNPGDSTRGSISQSGFFESNDDIDNTDFLIEIYMPDEPSRKGTFVVPVLERPVTYDTLTVTGPSTVEEGGVANFVATANFSDGSSQVVSSSASWSTTDGSISSSGALTAPLVGSDTVVTVTATYNGKSGTADVTVTDIPVPVSLEITGATTMPENDSIALTAIVTYSDTTTQTVTSTASWSSSNTGIATVNAGNVSSLEVNADSSVTITAEFTDQGQTVSDTHSITVTDQAAGAYGPRWGTIGPQASGGSIRSVADFDEAFLQTLNKDLTGVDGETFTMVGGVDSFDNPDGGFAPYVHNRVYVAYPAELGWARFVDDFGTAGGFDGATAMPDEPDPYTDSLGSVSVGQYSNNGGIQVTINGVDYIIYAQYMSSQNADFTMTLTYGGNKRMSGEL